MKKIFNTLLFLSFSVFTVNAEENEHHLFILSGQSNMARMKPKYSFAPTLEKKFGKDNIIIVKDAKSGGPIRFWYKKGELEKKDRNPRGWLYDRLMTQVKEEIKGKKIKAVTFVWMQGESDTKANGKNYASHLRGVLAQLREDLKIKDLNVVIGRISDLGNGKDRPHWDTVRKALVEVAESEPFGGWINTDDLNDMTRDGKTWNDLHYTGEGYKKLGLRFANKAIELIEKSEQKK